MSVAFYTGVAGMLANQTAMDATAHNVTNLNTVGYKAKDACFSDLLYTRMNTHANYDGSNMVAQPADAEVDVEDQKQLDMMGHGVRVSELRLDYTQGGFDFSGRDLDFAIDGDGLFAIKKDREILYTRNGAFQLSIEGRRAYLVNNQGYYVLDGKGKQIEATVDRTTGQVSLDGLLEKIGVYHFENPYGLLPADGGSYYETETSGKPVAQKATETDSRVLQYALENSNVDLSQQMVNIIVAQRAYQMSSRVVQTADEMDNLLNNMR